MTKRRMIGLILVLVMTLTLFTGCDALSGQGGQQAAAAPEVGVWHAEVRLSDLTGSMSDEDRMLMAMLAGNIAFEVDVQFYGDGTFAYLVNTDQLQKALSDTVNTMFGFFFSYDISLFTDRLLEMAMKDAMQDVKQSYYGTYTKDANDIITAVDGGEYIYFRLAVGRLIQIDSAGNEVLVFTKQK